MDDCCIRWHTYRIVLLQKSHYGAVLNLRDKSVSIIDEVFVHGACLLVVLMLIQNVNSRSKDDSEIEC